MLPPGSYAYKKDELPQWKQKQDFFAPDKERLCLLEICRSKLVHSNKVYKLFSNKCIFSKIIIALSGIT